MKFTLELELNNETMKSYFNVRDALRATIETTTKYFNERANSIEVGDNNIVLDDDENQIGSWKITDNEQNS